MLHILDFEDQLADAVQSKHNASGFAKPASKQTQNWQ